MRATRRDMRPTDRVAERLLRVVLRLERAPWPGAQSAYAAALLALATRCHLPVAKAEVYRWFVCQAGGSLVAVGHGRRERLRDAFHDAVARLPEVLLRFRAGLDSGRRPNVRSMLVKWIYWRAGDLYSAEQRHDARKAIEQVEDQPAPERTDATVELGEVLALLDGADPRQRALRLVALGHSVAHAARLTGASRQQVYRARDALWQEYRGVDPPRRARR